MFDEVISTGLQAVLAEVFESVDKKQLNVSLVGDIFKESHLELTDLRLKKTLLKDMNLPVDVKEGLVGRLVIQGLSGECSAREAFACNVDVNLRAFAALTRIGMRLITVVFSFFPAEGNSSSSARWLPQRPEPCFFCFEVACRVGTARRKAASCSSLLGEVCGFGGVSIHLDSPSLTLSGERCCLAAPHNFLLDSFT